MLSETAAPPDAIEAPPDAIAAGLDLAAPGWTLRDHGRAGAVLTYDVAVPAGQGARAAQALVKAGFVVVPGSADGGLELLRLDGPEVRWTRVLLSDGGVARRRRHARGISVALVGPDGSGKSTLGSALAELAPIPTSVVYMGIWRPGRLRMAGPLANVVQLAYRPFKLWAYYLYSLSLKRRGHLVVYDRYTYDAHLPPRPPLAGLKRAYLRVIAKLLPHPDLVLFLKVGGETMFRRKGQHTPAKLQESMERLLRVVEGLPQGRVIEGDRPPGEVRSQAMEEIWQCLRRRWTSSNPG